MHPRVFHLVHNLIRGGSEGQCARVAMRFAALGPYHRVGVSRREGFFLEAVQRACGPVYEMQIDSLLRWKTWREVRRLASHLRDGQFDLLHAWDADAVIFGSWAARLAGIPVITSQRDLGQIYTKWKWRLMVRAHRRALRVVVNADAIRERLGTCRVAATRIRVIPNLIDLDEFDRLGALPFSGREALPPPPRVTAVSRLDPEKDTVTLLRAAARLRDQGIWLSLVLAGDGVERERLEAECQVLNLTDGIRFLGEISEVPGLLREVSVGILAPVRNEGLSNSILEYMAAGLPVVATDCGGNRELVEDGRSGLLVKPGDAEGMANALRQLLQAPDRAAAMGRRGREIVETRFSEAPVLDAFRALYEEASRRGR